VLVCIKITIIILLFQNVQERRNRGYIPQRFLEQDQGNIRSAHSSVFDKRKIRIILNWSL